MANDIKVLIKTILEDKDFKKGLKTMDSGMTKSAKKQESLLEKMKKNWLAVGASIAAVVVIIKKAFDFAKEFAEYKQGMDALERNTGQNADKIIKKLKEVTKGTVANKDIMLAANRLVALNVTKDTDKMAKLFEIARVKAKAMGITTAQAVNDIATGIGRQSPLILDNLGIITKGWDKEAKAAGKAMDSQFILNKILAQGAVELGKVGAGALTDAERMQQFSAAMTNLKLILGGFASKFIMPLIQGMTEFIRTLEFVISLGSKTEFELSKVDKAILTLGKSVGRSDDATKRNIVTLNEWATKLENSRNRIELLKKAGLRKHLKEASELTKVYNKNLDKFNEGLKTMGFTSIKSAEQFLQAMNVLKQEQAAFESKDIGGGKGISPVATKAEADKESLVEYYEFVGEQREADLLKEEEAKVAALESLNANYDEKLRMEEEYQTKLTDLEAAHVKNVEKIDKAQAKADESLRKAEFAATKSALNDVESLMQSSSKELFAIGKAASLASATINTIEAVTKTMASVPLPLNIPLAIAQAAAGAIQVAKIASTTPGFAEGTDFAPGGQAIVGEKGVELVNLPRGAEVVPNRSLPQDIGQMITNNISNESQSIDNTQNTINVDNPTDLIESLNQLEQSYGFKVLQR